MAANPTKLTKKLQEAVCECLRKGHSWNRTAKIVGVDASTIRRWRRDGKANVDAKHARFTRAVEEAQTSLVDNGLKAISRHGEKSWQAWAWLLERLYPDEFARRDPEEIAALEARLTAMEALAASTRSTPLAPEKVP